MPTPIKLRRALPTTDASYYASRKTTHRLVVHVSQLWLVVSSVNFLILLIIGLIATVSSPASTSAALPSPSTLTVRVLLERARMTWSILFREQQDALKGVKSLVEAKNLIECYAKYGQFNVRHKKAMKTTFANNQTNSAAPPPDSSQFLTNNGSFCVPDFMGGYCFPPHPAATQYNYLCMDDAELREILDSCRDYNRFKEAYATRLCSANATWSPSIDFESMQSIVLPNGTILPALSCISLIERCYSTQLERDSAKVTRTANGDSNHQQNMGRFDGDILLGGDDLSALNDSDFAKTNNDLINTKAAAAAAAASCSTKKSDTVRQIATLVALLDLCFSAISFILLCLTLFIFLFFKSLHCGRISIHTNLAVSLLLRTTLHIMFMAYKLYIDYAKRVRTAEQQQLHHQAVLAAAAHAAMMPSQATALDAGDLLETLGIGSIASFVNDDDGELLAPIYNSSETSHSSSSSMTTTTPSGASILDAVLIAAGFDQQQNNSNNNYAANQYGANMTQVGVVAPIWQVSDAVCKALLTVYFYATVASVLWMFVEGYHLAQRIALSVFRGETNFLLFYFVGWILPLLFVLAWVVAMELTTQCYCWANYDHSEWKWLIAGPMISALIVNAFFLIAIITIVITKLQANDTAEMAQVRKALKATIILFPLLGVSFLFSAVNPNDDGAGESAYYISNAVLQGSQGIFVAVIYCFCNSEVHQAVKRYYYRILLRRGDYRRSSRIAMTSMEGNPLTVAATLAERRKSSAPAGHMQGFAQSTAMNALLPATTHAENHQQHENHHLSSQSTLVDANHVFVDVNASPTNNHVTTKATTNVGQSDISNNNNNSRTITRKPSFRYRTASCSAASGASTTTPISTIAPLSATIINIHKNPAVSDNMIRNKSDNMTSDADSQHAIANIDDDDEEEEEEEDSDENSAASKRLNAINNNGFDKKPANKDVKRWKGGGLSTDIDFVESEGGVVEDNNIYHSANQQPQSDSVPGF